MSPWGELYLEGDGTMKTCCVASESLGNIQYENWQDIWNNDNTKKIRKTILDNKWPKNCDICMKNEASGQFSFRHYLNSEFGHNYTDIDKTTTQEGIDTKKKITFLDIRWSNLCNYSCIMCGSPLSSKWAELEQKYFGSTKPVIRNTTEQLIDVEKLPLDDLEKIYLAGGEPLLHPKTYELLERCIREGKTDIRLMINSNMSTLKYKKTDVIDLLSKFKHVYFIMSIDDYGERAEYIRQGCHWPSVEKNIRRVSELSGEQSTFDIVFSPTLTLWNTLHLPDFVSWCKENLGDRVAKNSLLNVCHEPWYFNSVYLPDDMRQASIDGLRDLYKTLEAGTFSHMLSNEIHRQETAVVTDEAWSEFLTVMKEKIQFHQKVFKMNPEEIFPELSPLFNEIKEHHNGV